jgi:hypothetical protein
VKAATMKTTDPIEQYVNAQGNGWCTKYVLVAVTEDSDGDQSFFIQCSKDQTATETVGLCEAVSHIQKTKIARAWIEREHRDTDDE